MLSKMIILHRPAFSLGRVHATCIQFGKLYVFVWLYEFN